MKRLTVMVVLSCLLAGLVAHSADAQRRRRRRGRQQPTEQVAPRSEAIAPELGELRWGMSRDEVYEHFVKKIREKYRERMREATDALTEDRLRHEMSEEIQNIRNSYVRFRGQTTGWDVSFLRDEFTHNNGEAMLFVREGDSQNFFFFIRNRLWKWYKAFNASVFEGMSFEQFGEALQGRYGRALERNGRLTERGQQKRWLEWQDETTRLRAVDENQFYGFYCLVFEDKATVAQIAELRTNGGRPGDQGHALVDAVVNDRSAEQNPNENIVDQLTGRNRGRTNGN